MQSMADMLSAPGGSQQKCNGIALAEVTAIKDPKNHGRVKCRYLTADKNLGETGWIYCLTPFGGKEYGCFFHPGIGDIVALAYEDGDVHRPFVIGSLWAKKNTPPASVSDGKNEIFKLITPNKSYVEFSDAPKKEHITVSTPKGHRIDLDDENDVISVTDGKNKLDISGKSGSVELTCEKKLTIKVGSGVTITCDGNSGAVEIKTNSKIELNSAKIGVKASGEASVEGSGSVTVKSSGVMTIKGSMTKIN